MAEYLTGLWAAVTPYISDADFTLYVGDIRACLAELPDESVHCVVTSPPYWGLRDYGTGSWAGGDRICSGCGCRWDPEDKDEHDERRGDECPSCGYSGPWKECDHRSPGGGVKQGLRNDGRKHEGVYDGERYARSEAVYHDVCGKCGATRTDQQLGLEPTPELYVENMVAVFREVRRVMRKDATLWLNLGDAYAQGSKGNSGEIRPGDKQGTNARSLATRRGTALGPNRTGGTNGFAKPKDLLGMPWRVAFALQADGWYLRAEITWCKKNCMPESVTDRPTKATEKVFLLTRSPTYFYDQDAVREPHSPDGRAVTTLPVGPNSHENHAGRNGHERWPGTGRNMRDFWLLATEPYPDAHFATFPQALVEPCVKAGTSERGCCPVCGAPWERETTVEQERLNGNKGRATPKPGANNWAGVVARTIRHIETTGWKPTCSSDCLGADYTPVPCTVLDPFMGSGTVALVSRKLGRRSIGVELNQAYAELAAKRLGQQSLFAEAR